MDKPESPRDDNGRFAQGNPGGPGRSKGRGYELQRAAQDAVTPEHMTAMIRKALRMALEGNLTAMRFVAERTLGRPPEASIQGDPIGLSLPSLRTAASCATAIDRLVEAVSEGAIDLNAAKVMHDLVQTRLKAIEVNDLEQRLTELEKTASVVDKNGGHHGRRF
ncbi:MAG: hypothetical protein ABIP94_05465 [Planctomycetota bacterium]